MWHEKIILDKKSTILYKRLRVLLIATFFGIGTVIAYTLIFPATTVRFDFENPDSLKNTLTTPHNNDGLTFHGGISGDHTRARVTLTTADDFDASALHVSVRKVYQAFSNPLTNALSTADEGLISHNDDPFPSGALLSSSDAVYIRDGTLIRPFDTSETFKSFGYSFDNVIASNSEQRSAYKKGRLFTLRDAHPPGTLFYTTDTQQHFLVTTENTLLSLASDTLIREDAQIVSTQQESRDRTVTCAFAKKSMAAHKYVCTLDLTDIARFTSNNYAFLIDTQSPHTQQNAHIRKIDVRFIQTPTKKNRQTTMGLLKKRLLQNYNLDSNE